jgi:hypothetical protein
MATRGSWDKIDESVVEQKAHEKRVAFPPKQWKMSQQGWAMQVTQVPPLDGALPRSSHVRGLTTPQRDVQKGKNGVS